VKKASNPPGAVGFPVDSIGRRRQSLRKTVETGRPYKLPHLRELPVAARVLLTLFLALIGGGYLCALGNLYHRHSLADDRPGLTFNDLLANFHGIPSDFAASSGGAATANSRMAQMVAPGAPMRKHLNEGGLPAVRSLTDWLGRGAPKDGFTAADRPEPGDPSPAKILQRHCLRCHNAEDGEKKDAPYGPDLFDVDYDLVCRYAAPGTAAPPEGAKGTAGDGTVTIGPQSLSHLFLVSHIHMLAMPVFTLILGLLVLMTGLPVRIRTPLALLPMAAMVCDFSCWWLSRAAEPATYVIAAAGAGYGICLAAQILCVAGAMWVGRPSPPSA